MNYSKLIIYRLLVGLMGVISWILITGSLEVVAAHESGESIPVKKSHDDFESTVWWKTILADSVEDKDLRLAAADSLLLRFPHDITILREKINILKDKGDIKGAIELYSEILKNPDIRIDISKKIRMQVDYLYLLQSIGRYSAVILNAHEYLSQQHPDSLLYMELPIRMFMMNVAVTSHQLEAARQYLEDARKVCERLKKAKIPQENIAYAQRQLLKGDIIYSIHNNDFKKTLLYVDSLRSIGREPSVEEFFDMCLPIAYDGMGQKEYAENLYIKTLSKSVSPDLRLTNIKNYVSFLLKYDRPEEALRLIDQNLDLPVWMRQHPSYVEFLALKGETLGALGKYEEGYRCLDLYRSMTDSINAQERQGDALFGIEQLKLTDRLETEENRTHRYSSRIIVAVSVSIIFLVIMIICMFKIRAYRSRLKETDLTLAAIVDKNKEKLEASNEKIAGQQRELVGRGLELARMSGVVAQMNEIITDSDTGPQEKINAMKVALKGFKADKDVWEAFRIYFELTHPGFIRNLREKCPDLTQKEIRLCAFILMNLTTKEIANLTSRVPRSVETMKYRLSRKLDVPTGETLHKFLSELNHS